MKALRAAAAAGAAFLCLAADGGTRPLRVATLNTILTEIAREVGGAGAEVVGLVAPGVDPHTFNPSPADIRAVVDADVILASGLNIEVYLDRLSADVGPKGRLVAVGDELPASMLITGEGGRAEKDPHWWHSIANMLVAVDVVEREFARDRPALATQFRANAEGYCARLRILRKWAEGEMEGLPRERRHLVTSHDAFGYFARDFGFTIHAITGPSTESEADARNVAALIDLIRLDRIGAVFAESTVDPRLVGDLVRETGVRLGGTLYADGLGPPGSGAETYDLMYRRNVLLIVGALSGNGP